jgi:hypothetical protein
VQIKFSIIIFLVLSAFSWQVSAEIRPANNARLNYNQVMFECDEVTGADLYVITIFLVDRKTSNPREPVIIKRNSLACMVSGLQFGKTYHWYYEAYQGEKKLSRSSDLYFFIEPSYLVDPKLFQSTITSATPGKYNDDIIFLDYRGIAIDRKGQPVWYYPVPSSNFDKDPLLRNLRMTKDGTITCLDDSSCYEYSVEGKLLWKAPVDGKISGDTKEHYHHDFKKLDDGTYLTAGWKYEYEPNFYNPSLRCQVRYNTLIQYDANGKIVWWWNEKDHVSKETIFGVYQATDTIISGTHMNAFDYDAKEDAIVMGCRHNSSIVKIDKKTGKVIYQAGVYDNRKKSLGFEPLFLHQHGMAIMPGHQLLIYDNNASDVPAKGITYPRILIIREPSDNLPAYKAWEYECRSDRFPKGILGKGGYAIPLPNGNILACMGGANFAFEVTPQKEIVWQSFFEKYDSSNHRWTDFVNYRAVSSSSLYPFYYTLQQAERKNANIVFKINNDGSEDDVYVIEYKTSDGKTISTKELTVKKNSSQKMLLRLKSKYSKQDIIISVARKSNKSQAKTIRINKQA